MPFRSNKIAQLGLPAVSASLLGLLLLGCANSDSPGMDDGADTDTADTDDAPETGASTTGTDPSDGSGTSDGTTGAPDPTQGEETTGDDGTTGGEVDLGPYRVVFASVEGGVTRLYAADETLEHVTGLTPAGIDSVNLDFATFSPRLHADQLHLAALRGPTMSVIDVFSGEVSDLAVNGLEVERATWSPTELVLAVLEDDRQLRRVPGDGTEATLIYDFTDDNQPNQSVSFSWSPLGDRLSIVSRPDDSTPWLWAVDDDGENAEPIFAPQSATQITRNWSDAGDSLWFVGDASPADAGRDLGIGERSGYTVLSTGHSNVRTARRSGDGSRFVYLADQGIAGVDADGTDHFVVGPTVLPDDSAHLAINDDGAFFSLVTEGRLVIGDASLYNPLEIHADGVQNSSSFEPGGARLAYARSASAGAPPDLVLLDGDGPDVVSTPLGDDEGVAAFGWIWGGLMYITGDATGATGLYHTTAGSDPLFVPEPGEQFELAVSADEKRLVVQTFDEAGDGGRLCSFDVEDAAAVIELGCTTYNASDNATFVAIAHDPSQ